MLLVCTRVFVRYWCGVIVTISFRSEKVTNLHITIIIFFFVCLGYTCLQTPIAAATRKIISNKTIEWKEQIPGKLKDGLQKWQHAFGTPFRDAATVKADTGQMVRTVFTRKRQYDLRPL